MKTILVALFALAAPAAAQQPTFQPDFRGRAPALGPQGPTVVAEPIAVALAAFDADQDGRVSRAEAAAGAARSFAAVANGATDIGYIGYSAWALRYLGDANAAPGPFETDVDRNNRITAAEVAATLLAAFDRFDADKDGSLSRAELMTVRATAFGEERKGKRKPAQ